MTRSSSRIFLLSPADSSGEPGHVLLDYDPLTWEEVARGPRFEDFRIDNVRTPPV